MPAPFASGQRCADEGQIVCLGAAAGKGQFRRLAFQPFAEQQTRLFHYRFCPPPVGMQTGGIAPGFLHNGLHRLPNALVRRCGSAVIEVNGHDFPLKI